MFRCILGSLLVLIALIAVVLLHPPLATADETIAGAEHWVQGISGLDGKPLKLYVREKRLKATDPSAFAKSGKVVLLAHGAGTPADPDTVDRETHPDDEAPIRAFVKRHLPVADGPCYY